ncbi:MAG TPA: helix-turn-helix domain-containing protein [Candidatus Thermoplasmatota archaeon]|jgi:sugar-specific transcriptional regulator TrmB|nr:helix-turn-helix domain-containing protein [Candidatus Thermoplasmatota archaeon]
MPINPTRLEKMQEYGLTEYEARTYLALLDLGTATARDIANLSRVPRTKIYSVLDELHQKQLAQVIPERPKRYEVVPFDVYLQGFEKQYLGKLRQIEEDKRFLQSELRRTPRTQAGEKAGSFNVIKGRKNVVNKKYEMLARAQRSLLEMGSEFMAARTAYFLPALREKAAQGVTIELLCPVVDVSAPVVRDLLCLGQVRHPQARTLGSATLIVDDSEVLMCHYVPDDEHLFKGDDVAIWSDDKAIVADMKATIVAAWETGLDAQGVLAALARDGSLAEGPDLRA